MKQRLLNTLLITVLLGFLWSVFFIARFLLEEEVSTVHLHVPEEATFALELDGRSISSSILTSTLFETRDEEIIQLVEEQLAKKTTKETPEVSDAIDYLSPVIFFQVPINGRTLNGWIVSVNNASAFQKQFSVPGIVSAVHDHIGVVFKLPVRLKNKRSIVQKIASEIVLKKGKSPLQSIPKNEKGQIIRFFLSGKFWGSEFERAFSTAQLALSDDALTLTGVLVGEGQLAPKPKWEQLKPKGFHLSSSLLPPSAIDSLNKLTSDYGLILPPLSGFSMNYFGTKIITHSGGVIAVPQMELLLHCAKPFKVDTLLNAYQLQDIFKYEKLNGKLHWDNEDLFYKQIDERTIYVGINETPSLYIPISSQWLLAKGSITPLLAVDGGKIVQAILEMLPIYRSSQAWARSMKDVDVSVKRTKKGQVEMSAKITMQPGKKPLNELLKFMLTSELID
jgi:hypothetical protein